MKTIVIRSLVIMGIVGSISIKGASASTGPWRVAVAPDPSATFGRFVYVATSSSDIAMYTIDPTTGVLTSIGAVNVGHSVSSVAVDPSGNFLYATTASPGFFDPGTVSMYSIDAVTGTLTSLGTVLAGVGPRQVVVDNSGRFAYAANVGFDVFIYGSVSTYSLDETSGLLTPGETFSWDDIGGNAVSMTLDPFTRFAYVAGLTDHVGFVLVSYAIDATTGALSFVQWLDAGDEPTSVTEDPPGRFVYVADHGGGMFMFAIDPTTGALNFIGSVDAGGHPTSVAVEPSGRFAYVANCLDTEDACDLRTSTAPGNVSIFSIDATTGSLTSIGTTDTGADPTSIAIDPSGNFAYVTNYKSNSVSMYSIDAVTGALTLIGTIGT
jgi:6-phosphogluconolactonase (cycloisomerase 2 family)